MANNKVIDKEGNVLLDLTGDDVTAADVMSGKKFHGRDGVQGTGSYTPVDLSTDTAVPGDVRLGKTFHSGDNAQKTGTYDPGSDISLSDLWETFKSNWPNRWDHAFASYPSYHSVLTYVESFDNLDFSGSLNITNTDSMFYGCRALSFPLFDTSNVTIMSHMFHSCSQMTTIPAYNTSNVTSMEHMFDWCLNLVSVPALDVSKVTNMSGMFASCSKLEEIHMTGMKVAFDISPSTKFTESALVEILNNLATVTSTKTLTMGSTNLVKLTAEEKAIATNKGWTLA